MKTLEQHYISKIEGHGYLKTNLSANRTKMVVETGERYFEKLVVGRRFEDAPYITARICGVCPVAHLIASIKAVEDAFAIEVNETIKDMRKILMAAQVIQSHTLHLYFLALGDYLGFDTTISLYDKDPKKLRAAFDLKHFADDVVEAIGGKAVHPTTPTVGGFRKYPAKNAIDTILNKAQKQLASAKMTIELFAKFKYPDLSEKSEFLSLKDYDYYEGSVISNFDSGFFPREYKKRIKETIHSGSSAKFTLHHGKNIDHFPKVRPFMSGALARINNLAEKLYPKAKIEKSTALPTPDYNPYHNNIAQAIEILHSLEMIIELCQKLAKEKWQEKMVRVKPKKSSGAAAVEAPRGTLFHSAKTNKAGEIIEYDIIPPTTQNLSKIESDAKTLIRTTKSLSSIKRKNLLEMLVRAYDPCITCSVH